MDLSSIDKRYLLDKLADQIASDLAVLNQAAASAHQAATHSESKAEDQYDTRGLEAAYLAGAQSKRATDLESLLALYRHVDLLVFTAESKIASTALVEVLLEGSSVYYFLMPLGGGRSVYVGEKKITVITPQSPTGAALLGHQAGDDIEVEIQGQARELTIIAVA